MEDHLSNALADELDRLKASCLSETGKQEPASFAWTSEKRAGQVAGMTAGLVRLLARAPHTPAREVAGRTGMDRDELRLSYKLIQRTEAAAEYIRASPNGDYLNIVNHYFNRRMYVVVFFVGLSCPGRCLFCPNVTVDSDGERCLSRYPGEKKDLMSPREIEVVFNDIRELEDQGTFVLLKISGGLEPLTDPATMAVILDRAQAGGYHVKLFTNGLLLNTAERRRLALKASDIRISLSVLDANEYARVMFGNDRARKKIYRLSFLLDNIRHLVEEREKINPRGRIGINTIVLEENHRDIEGFIHLAKNLGIDYIDFKPNYFSPYAEGTQEAIRETIARVNQSGRTLPVETYFAGSLSGDNLFWTHRQGVCHPHKQSRYKLFITPFGICSPVHHGAFPSASPGTPGTGPSYIGGRITRDSSLLDIIDNMPVLPDLEYEKLNPFEHMLALEIEREEKDRDWGIPEAWDPYHFSMAGTLPPDLMQILARQRI